MKKLIAILFAGVFAVSCMGQAADAAKKADAQKLSAVEASYSNADNAETRTIGERIVSQIFCYVPNRVMDFLDMTSLDIKSGLYTGIGFQLTKYFGLGYQGGVNIGAYKDVNRQYGLGFERGYQAQFLFLTMENISVTDPIGTVKDYWRHGYNFPSRNDEVYAIGKGARDYWAIEVYAYLLAGAKVGVHPIEIADFFTGLVCFDIIGDDISLKMY